MLIPRQSVCLAFIDALPTLAGIEHYRACPSMSFDSGNNVLFLYQTLSKRNMDVPAIFPAFSIVCSTSVGIRRAWNLPRSR
jgi:hypothetical protein